MNLTFIIGNGFDLGLGLKTSYKDFLNCYLCDFCSKGDFPAVEEFKKIIRTDLESWADAEKALGEFDYVTLGNKCQGNKDSGSASAILDIRSRLKTYIEHCQEKFPKDIPQDICSKFRQSLLSIHTGLIDEKAKKDFYNGISSISVNFINFNYTRTLDTLIREEGNLHNTTFEIDETKIGAVFQKPLHVHGEIHDASDKTKGDAIFGIGDSTQLTGIPKEHGAVYETLKSILLKKDEEKAHREGDVVAEAVSALEKSDYIVLFGVTLGITDCFWWRKMLHIMHDKPKIKIIYSPYHDGCKKCFDSSTFEKEEKLSVAKKFAENLSPRDIESFADGRLVDFRERLLIIGPGPHRDFGGTLRCYDPLHLSWFKTALNI